MGQVQKLIDASILELGYLEKKSNAYLDSKTQNAGSNNYTKYARDMYDHYREVLNGNKQGYSWCCVFILYLFCETYTMDKAMQMLKLPPNSLAATVKYFREYMNAYGLVHDKPNVGDIVFFGDQHVGLVTDVSNNGTVFYTIEGNTNSGTNTIIANGGAVCRKTYTYIKSSYKFGTPDWSVVGGYDYKNNKGDYDLTFRILKKGCKGDDVKAIQALLTGYSYNVSIIDGDFGSNTENAVKNYQRNHFECGEIDGIIGEKTMRSMLGK